MTSDNTKDDNTKEQGFFVEYLPASRALQAKTPFMDKTVRSVLRQADMMLAGKRDSYLEWVKEDIKDIEVAFQNLKSATASKPAIEKLYMISHKMKGEGGTFGYPLVTYILHNLCRYLDVNHQLSSQNLTVIELHINAIKLIISNKLSQEGGLMGKKIIAGLEKVIVKPQRRRDEKLPSSTV